MNLTDPLHQACWEARVCSGECGYATIRAGFASLDGVDLEGIFLVRACVMKSAPTFLKGVLFCDACGIAGG